MKNIFFYILFLIPATLNAEELWHFEEYNPILHSMVKIKTDKGIGTGLIIEVDPTVEVGDGYLGKCITASHVIKDSSNIMVYYYNNRACKKARILASNDINDIAILWVWIPKGINPVPLASGPIEPFKKIYIAGYGGNPDMLSPRFFSSITALTTDENYIYSDVPLIPGDSGGPVFYYDEILGQYFTVGVVSGGWFWQKNYTWPGRFCNIRPIRNLIAQK